MYRCQLAHRCCCAHAAASAGCGKQCHLGATLNAYSAQTPINKNHASSHVHRTLLTFPAYACAPMWRSSCANSVQLLLDPYSAQVLQSPYRHFSLNLNAADTPHLKADDHHPSLSSLTEVHAQWSQQHQFWISTALACPRHPATSAKAHTQTDHKHCCVVPPI